ncbi:hypothetical protein Glove_110g49 [Diversispora epigaea]|uniref:Uncharacterized protein n=1 Tax=Diversispora epigaea TaxID=1348612 RepID=A0A397J897_9GLOM|nr:hypothetical protein Glove_110g49 [Diversispora epigaea]
MYSPADIPPSPINHYTNNTIKIGTHNIRGINTIHEQMLFSHYLKTHNFDIIGISETKFKKSATNFAFKEQDIYKYFWSSNDLEPRETGIGLLIKKDIAKHIQKVFRFDGRLLSVSLLFKGKSRILIIQVYLSSDKKSSRIYQTQIRKLITEETKKNINIIIMGDFNAVVLPHLDRLSRGKDKVSIPSHKPEIPLFDFFEDWAFTDLQATWQGDKHTFTWKNSLSEKFYSDGSLTEQGTQHMCIALLTAPSQCKVKINTDSQTCIDIFKYITSKPLTTRQWLRLNNHIVWLRILETVKTKDLSVILFKIKAHSGVIFNEVDRLAKNALNLKPIQFNIIDTGPLFTVPTWDIFFVNINTRNFIKQMHKYINLYTWKSQNRIKKFLTDDPLDQSSSD